MAYERKTIDTWELQLNYGYGWEYTLTEYTKKEARERLKEYRENQPQYPARLVKSKKGGGCMSSTAKLTAEQIENLAKEIREFLLEHGLWQDVDIYFNGKRFTQHDPVTGKYYYNDREHLIEVADQPERHFEYVNPEHILSMSFEGPVCEMLYYGILPSVRREFDKIFERYGLYYEFGHHWNFSCYYI